MLLIAGAATTADDARRQMEKAIGTGRAAEHFQRIIEAQGGNPGVVEDPAALPQAAECELFNSPRRGFVARVEPPSVADARKWMIASTRLWASSSRRGPVIGWSRGNRWRRSLRAIARASKAESKRCVKRWLLPTRPIRRYRSSHIA
jgi:hypothetical protein